MDLDSELFNKQLSGWLKERQEETIKDFHSKLDLLRAFIAKQRGLCSRRSLWNNRMQRSKGEGGGGGEMVNRILEKEVANQEILLFQ